MNNPENWKATKAQKEELLVLWTKLGWKIEDYGGDLKWDELLWHQINAMISGAEEVLNNPKQWIIK